MFFVFLLFQIFLLSCSFRSATSLYEFQGISAYYEPHNNTSRLCNTNMENLKGFYYGPIKEFDNYFLGHLYLSGYIKIYKQGSINYSDDIKLKSPERGALFCTDNFFGIIDVKEKNAFLFNACGERKIDFSNFIPWDVTKGRIELFLKIINDNTYELAINFSQDSYRCDSLHFKPRIQVIYELTHYSNDITLKKVSTASESLSLKQWILSKVMRFLHLIDTLIDKNGFEYDREVSSVWQAIMIKAFILNSFGGPCLYYGVSWLFNRSKNNFFSFIVTFVCAIKAFYFIEPVYAVHLFRSPSIVTFE